MVSIAPNIFRIEGRILDKKKDTLLDHFVAVTVSLEKVERLRGPSAYLDDSEKQVTVIMTEAIAVDLEEGMFIDCKIRKAIRHFFILPESLTTKKNK